MQHKEKGAHPDGALVVYMGVIVVEFKPGRPA